MNVKFPWSRVGWVPRSERRHPHKRIRKTNKFNVYIYKDNGRVQVVTSVIK